MDNCPTSTPIDDELQFNFVRASGPGGQNINKVATAVQLRFDVENSPSLPPEHKLRLKRLAGKRMTADGWLVIDARRFRSQDKNKADAIQRFHGLLEHSSRAPAPRHATKRTLASQQKRLEVKKVQSRKKSERQKVKINLD